MSLNAHEGQTAYWDLAPAERPDKVLAEIRHVAKKENIPVKIEKVNSRTLLLFYISEKERTQVRVKRDNAVLAVRTESVGGK